VTNWSVDWPEAIELESMVVNSFVDATTQVEVKEKHPRFLAFAYKPFQGGLTNIKKSTAEKLQPVKSECISDEKIRTFITPKIGLCPHFSRAATSLWCFFLIFVSPPWNGL
jgi:hypothetical protein